MRCSKARHQLELKQDKELKQSSVPALELHLSHCPNCREYQAQAARLKQILTTELQPDFPAWIHHQIMDKTIQHDRKRLSYRRRWKLQAVPALLAVLLSLSVGGLVGKAVFATLVPFPKVVSTTAQDGSRDGASFGELSLLDDASFSGENNE